MLAILMISTKLAALDFFKLKVMTSKFLSKITNKISSYNSNDIADVVM